MRILVIEDDFYTAESIREGTKKRYAVDIAHTGEEGLFQSEVNEYDIIIIDLKLPDMTGIEVCRKLRETHVTAPILMLTASSEIDDKVTSLDSGADDYLSKPFNFPELLARLRALTRRAQVDPGSNKLVVGDLMVDVSAGIAEHKGVKLALRRKEFLLLEYLMRNVGKVVTRNMLLEHVWDSSADPITNTVDVHIKFLRDKVDKPFGTKLIKTMHGLGYKLDAVPTEAAN